MLANTDIPVNTRARLSPAQSRAAAIEAARALLIEEGPGAVTLKAVAARVGKTHANVLHHFGSAAGLQQALAAHISERVTAGIGEAVEAAWRGDADEALIVERTFDAFEREGAGALASWMILTGETAALKPILRAIHDLVERLGEGNPGHPVREHTLGLVLLALGQSLLGGPMADALDLPPGAARELGRRLIGRHRVAEDANKD